MKKLLLLPYLSISFIAFNQEIKTVTFEDGIVYEYQVMSDNPDQMRKLHISPLEFDMRSNMTIGGVVSYTLPKYFYSKLDFSFGTSKFGIENNFFVLTKDVRKEHKITLVTTDDGYRKTSYKATDSYITRTQLALRLGYLICEYNNNNSFFKVNAKANELSYGIGLARTKHMKIKTLLNNPRISSSSLHTLLYLEALNYHSVKDNWTSEEPDEIKPLGDVSKMGFRMVLEGKYLGKSRVGPSYKVGFEKTLLREGKITPIISFGIFVAFL